MDDPRCARGARCEDAVTAYIDNTTRASVGALIVEPGRAFCPTCLRYLGYALNGLTLDVAELTTLMVPTMAIRYRDPDVPVAPRVKLHSPVPLQLAPEALRALIVHEVTAWASATAAEAGVPWDPTAADYSRAGAAVQAGAQLLAHRVDHFLGLPLRWHVVRSTGEHPTDGWSPEDLAAMRFDGRDLLIQRDGTHGALMMFRLHEEVEQLAGRAAADHLRMPCPKCERRALVREHRNGKVICRCCWREMSDDDYQALVDVTSDLFGIPR